MIRKDILIPTLIVLIFSAALKTDASNSILTINEVSITDLFGRSKKTYKDGDKIRYNLSFSVSLPSVVLASGKVVYNGAENETLKPQFKTLRPGDHSLFWDSIVPQGANGNASVEIRSLNIPGLSGKTSASFIVEVNEGNGTEGDADFIGSKACIVCHKDLNSDIVEAFQESGHNFALSFLTGDSPSYPDFSPGVPEPPAAFRWEDMDYVVGGYAWNSMFVNHEGRILTTGFDGTDTQYNLPSSFLETSGRFIPYGIDLTTPTPFDCASCHTTGYSDNGTQDGSLIVGAWKEAMVACEACHGPGSRHQRDPSNVKLKPNAEKSCSRCHVRDDNEVLEAEGGLILHRQQYEELTSGSKSFFKCNTCHNPHASAHFSRSAAGEAIVQDCISCHKDKTIAFGGMQDLSCYDCHMPFAVTSGAHISFTDLDGNNLEAGNMRSHIFTINSGADSPSEMFSSDGKSVARGSDGKVTGLTLNFVCLNCHREGGSAQRAYTFEQVKAFASLIH